MRPSNRYLIAYMLTTVFVACVDLRLGSACDDTSSSPNAARVLDSGISLSLRRVGIVDVIRAIHEQAHVSLSVIAPTGGGTVTIELGNARISDVLAEVVRQLPTYKVAVMNGRVILRPKGAEYDAIVRGVELKDVTRLVAARRYAEVLSREVPALAGVVGPIVLGNPNHPLFKEQVSLAAAASVTEHLAQLLGDDPAVAFLLVPAKSGVPILQIEYVR